MAVFYLITSVLLALLLLAPAAPAAPALDQAEGTIASVAADGLVISTRGGPQLRVTVSPDTTVIQRRRVGLEDIRPNDFVGVTARRELDGSLVALSINIFPPEFRTRIQQAQFVMDTGNVMTNATVFQNVRRVEGRTLYLKLNDGSAVITVPGDAVVLRLTLITVRDLRPGMTVTARGTRAADGSLTATTISVDINR